MGSLAVCVTDASIWIDLHAAGLVGRAFALPYVFCAPDVIVAETKSPRGRDIVQLGLREIEMSGEQVERVVRLAAKYPGPGRADLFALGLACDLGATLLTQDKLLRRAAESEGVPAHGTLWILEEMVRAGALGRAEAAEAVAAMRGKGSRLPEPQTERLIQRWTRQDDDP